MINEEKTKKEFGYEFATATIWKDFWCICDYCGKEFLRSKRNIKVGRKVLEKESCNSKECAKGKREESAMKLYGVKNAGGIESSKKKAVETFRKKYGVDNASQVDSVKEKARNTCIEKYGKSSYLATEECRKYTKEKWMAEYGVDWYTKSDEYKEKSRKTSLERYGKEFYSQTEIWLNKVKSTCKEKFGYDSWMQCPEIVEKLRLINLEKYGCEWFINLPEITETRKQNNIKKYGDEFYLRTDFGKKKFKETCMEIYGVPHPLQNKMVVQKMMKTKMDRYGTTNPINLGKTEVSICNWLNSLGFNFSKNHDLIGKEIDMLDMNVKLGIEYCGLYWHTDNSPAIRERNYHNDKYKKCLDKNVQLITLFSNEWKDKKEICKDTIGSKLGLFNRRIFARKCIVFQIDKKIFRTFCEKNHIEGGKGTRHLICYGLCYKNELVGAISLVYYLKKVFINRMVFVRGTQVIGGASKLFSRCITWARNNSIEEIITCTDNRWHDGNVYNLLGFEFLKEEAPSYKYVNLLSAKLLPKSFQKKLLTDVQSHFGKDNVGRIWDCGKKYWIYKV